MRDMGTPHRRMQDLCDCFAETDPLREMALLGRDEDREEAALKWLALAVLHGIDRGAQEISLQRAADGAVRVKARYRETELPSPGGDLGERIIRAARRIGHIEEEQDKSETPWAIGIRDSSIEVRVSIERQGDAERVTMEFGA